MGDNPDYVTVLPTNIPTKFLVAVMTYHKDQDDYAIRKCSQAMSRPSANWLATSWATALNLSLRTGLLP